MHLLDFEQSVAELEAKIEELRHLSVGGQVSIAGDVAKLQGKLDKQLKSLYAKLTPAQKVQVARHPDRPHTIEIIKNLIEDFVPLSGDRLFGDDQAIIGGLGRFRGTAVMVMGHERGHDTETRLKHNFGMAKPEGYRKAQRLMELAAKFNLPILSFVDTAGAFPGVDAEARGQAEAIAKGIEVCLQVAVPFVTTIIGEGGSGGAIAIAAADRVLMLEHAIYSVISPEGCASILWRSPSHASDAAEALRLTAQDLKELDVIDEIVPEPLGGAHRQKEETLARLADAIEKHLSDLIGTEPAKLIKNRQDKFLNMGQKSLAA
ncbi:MAG: acetyl-CoA carboxylase carboxyltransferase subunit alpha [Alphaproteobacteria bacterium]|nr:acetyl-CoA carboxylase carboxyltransferase subunit alpha [Alphaproteobacteria bacterium]